MRMIMPVPRHLDWATLLVLGTTVLVAGCDKPKNVEEIKSVRAMTVAKELHIAPLVMTGEIKAHTYVSASFRIPGKIAERMVSVGASVKAGQALARLDPQIEKDALAAAEAELAAAHAVLEEATRVERRAGILVQSKAVSQNDYDDALRQLKSARAQVEGAEAKLGVAREQLSFTLLKAEADGVITEKDAEVGEVVQPGQPVLRIANSNATDAVFDMPEEVIRRGLAAGQKMRVCLDADRTICAGGTLYEIAPQADQVTRTYLAKAILENVPRQMLLGATSVGTLQLPEEASIQIPASALTLSDGQPAVWLVAPSTKTVHTRPVRVERYSAESVVIADGLQPGDIVVTAGVQSLHQDQKISWQGEDHDKN